MAKKVVNLDSLGIPPHIEKEELLYVHVTKENKEFLRHESNKRKVSMTKLIDAILNQARGA